MERKNLIVLNSITYAMKAKEILIKKGIRSEIVRTPKDISPTGCSYSLYIPHNFSKAVSIIKESGIKIKGIVNGGNA